MERLVTIRQLSEIFQYSPRTIYDWVHVGFIPHYKFHRGIRFRVSEVEKWILNRRNKGRKGYKIEILT